MFVAHTKGRMHRASWQTAPMPPACCLPYSGAALKAIWHCSVQAHLCIVDRKFAQHSAWQLFWVHIIGILVHEQQLICLILNLLPSMTDWAEVASKRHTCCA